MLNPVWRLHLSWLVLAAGGLWGISVARNGGHGVGTSGTVQTALLTGYIAWALYWACRRSGAGGGEPGSTRTA